MNLEIQKVTFNAAISRIKNEADQLMGRACSRILDEKIIKKREKYNKEKGENVSLKIMTTPSF